MKRRSSRWAAKALTELSLFLPLVALPSGAAAQTAGEFAQSEAILRREHPQTWALVLRTERMQGIVYGKLLTEGEAVRERGDSLPSPTFETDMLDRLGRLATHDGTLEDMADEAEAGYESLGPRASGIIEWTNAFRRAVLGILADAGATRLPDRRAAIAEAIRVYQSRPEVALPTIPKNMDVLYTHKDAENFRTGYADLDGFIWAGHWMKLALNKPLVDLTGPERLAGLDTIQARYYSKLSYGEPPEFFPSELPLSPAIVPELNFISPAAASIWDNLTMMEEVLTDILASPDVPDERAAIDNAVTFFLDPARGVTDQLSFAAMALRHGIFFQGGFPLAVMTRSERNVGGHAAHLRGSGLTLPGM